ncbi:MAG: hypothetical protein GY797_27940 [Deltaproteobacteria bacterium]|nr:hypothetical protein [Deltaproteobacteria bacterium]
MMKTQIKDSYTTEELNRLPHKKSNDERFVKIDGYVFRRSTDGYWDNTFSKRFPAGSMAQKTTNEFDESVEHAKDGKQFVVDYVMWAAKEERKRLVKTQRGYELQLKCSDGWGVILWTKTADNMYNELERETDLLRFARTAEGIRANILKEVRA